MGRGPRDRPAHRRVERDGCASAPAAPPPAADGLLPAPRPEGLHLPPMGDEAVVAQLPSDPVHRATMNGSGAPPASVLTLDPDLDLQFEQVVGLQPNTEFKTPPRGTPAVSVPPVYDVTSTAVIGSPAVTTTDVPPAAVAAESAFDELWPQAGATTPAPAAPTAAALPEPVDSRLRFGLIDALLPILAVTLVVIVVLSWLG